ncbi:hypothetical protein HHI36_021697 [Cryptolaemus montrouzieri]|uniref:C2H2-type domain-containing protein n=1 Tax=Cryptolaemus montrouzieri TaxID=559131 RepID=A0ABD2MXV1_9CUCU
MEFSYMESAETSKLNELEDKSFINQFIEADGKIWERNNFIESHDVSFINQTHNSFKYHLPKIEPGYTEECFSVKKETGSKEFTDGKKKISDQEGFMKYECFEDTQAEKDENRVAIPEIEAELFKEDNKSIVHQLIDGKKWHEERISEDFPKLTKVEKDDSVSEREACETLDNNSQIEFKKNTSNVCGYSSAHNYECSHCDYQTNQKYILKRHVNSVHLGIKNHNCDHCDYKTSDKYYLTVHTKSVHFE